MSEFKREERYIVIKLKDLGEVPDYLRHEIVNAIKAAEFPRREFLVIESDWPEFEPTYQMIEARMTGKPSTTQEAWEAAGGNAGIKASHAELLSVLRLMNEAEDEAEAKTNQQKLEMDAACGEIALLKEELEAYRMSPGHQLAKGIVKAAVSQAVAGMSAACKATTESGFIATLECAQGDLRQAMKIIEKQQDLLRRTLDYYTESGFPEDLLVEVKAAIGDAS